MSDEQITIQLTEREARRLFVLMEEYEHRATERGVKLDEVTVSALDKLQRVIVHREISRRTREG